MALFPDLTAGKAQVERVLFGNATTDTPTTVIITRDTEGPDDDTFNTATGEWTRVGEILVYSGKGAVRAADPERLFEVGGGMELRSEWALRLPFSAPEPVPGDFVEILTNVRNPSLVGRRFRIDRVLGSTLGVVRKCVMYEFTPIGRELP